MEKHKELKNTLIDYSIVTCFDYIRTFDENNFTDFSLNKVSEIIKSESKYILVGMSSSNNKPFVLFNPNLENIHDEIYQKMVRSNRISGYNPERNRVFGYYEGDGLLRFGNKSSESIRIQFEQATIDDLIRKRFYISNIPPKIRHETVQKYLLTLGKSLGYYPSFAINDQKKLAKLYTNVLYEKTPNPEDLITRRTNKVHDWIDIIWFDQNRSVAAFEVEFSNNYSDAIRRLHSLDNELRTPEFYNIICSFDKNYSGIVKYCKDNISFINSLLPYSNLYFLPLSSLDKSLTLKDLYCFDKKITYRRNIFYNVNSLIPLSAILK